MKNNLIVIIFIFVTSYSLVAQISFQDEATNLGLNVSCGSPFLGSGLSLVDFDGDGLDDITLATGNGQVLRFFKNVNGSFIEQIINTINLNYQTKSVNWVDIDNDGDKDFFVTSNTNGNKLFKNNGNFIFEDITLSSGISLLNMFSFGASWGDFNNDGYLDVFISNRSEVFPNKLYKNNGDYTFTDISNSVGISNLGHMSFCSVFFDFNNDGWQDIYISNDKYDHANILYMNNGNGSFIDQSESSLTNVSIDAMTTTIGDYNNDGWFDIYVTNTPGGNVLLRNEGDSTFFNATQQSGTSFNSIGWGSVFFDAENDKDIDLYVSGSLDGTIPNLRSAAFYENLGTGVFQIPATSGFIGDIRESYSNAVGDLNNDGLTDIVVNNGGNGDVFIWKNHSITNNNWLKVNLEGVQSNKDGIGSTIEISINGIKQYRYTHSGEGYLSQNSLTKSFGIGDATIVDYIKITWLSGTIDYYYNLNKNQTLYLIEGAGTLSIIESEMNKIKIQPNPVKDLLSIKSNCNVIRGSIFDTASKLIKTIKIDSPQNTIDVSFLKTGLYILRIHTEENMYNFKFSKN